MDFLTCFDNFRILGYFVWIFWIFLDFIGIFWIILYFFVFFLLHFLIFFNIFFFGFLWIPYKVTKVTSKSYQGYYWTPKMGQNNIIRFFFPKEKKASSESRSLPQELEVGPRSAGPYLLVTVKMIMLICLPGPTTRGSRLSRRLTSVACCCWTASASWPRATCATRWG